MLSKKSDRECKHRQGAVGFAAKAGWAARIVAALLICTYAPLGLHAQDPCDAAILAPPVPPAPAPRKPCRTPNPKNIADATKNALACAWIDPNRTDQLLKALELLTSGPQAFDLNKKVHEQLTKGSAADKDLYRAALGYLDDSGQSAVQGLPDFLDTLAKANTRGTIEDSDKVKYQIKLFACTQYVVDHLFGTEGGKSAIAGINESFNRKNNYVALYQLLDAVWGQPQGSVYDELHLEKLRAAFDTNADLLAKQVAAKVTAAKN